MIVFSVVSSQNRGSMSELGVALKELGAVNAISLGEVCQLLLSAKLF